ncbi:MAG: tagatose 1,6-diphosphate aldolase [Dehalococcoidia bacterium]|nr:MAG: tagatose 1,6-diphosphate aldolase [Dehalococcoidia bacterium]
MRQMMNRLTIGKIRGLQQIANQDGILIMCAMDHRGSLRKMIDDEQPQKVSYEEMVARKLELCSSLAKYSSAVLLDPIFGAAQCVSHGVLPKDTGLLVSIEATGYSGDSEHRLTSLLEGWGVDKIRRMGGSAVKILLYYRPDLKQLASQQLKTVERVARECIKHDIPFLVEPKSYPIGGEVNNPQQFAIRKEELVIDTARDITALPIDVLKAEFPADLGYRKDKSELINLCRQLDSSSCVPWVILSAGVDFELFSRQVEIACRGGASGFLGGRAIWQEAVRIDNKKERIKYLETVAADRLKRLAEIASKYAVPWYKKLGMSRHQLATISETWYQQY